MSESFEILVMLAALGTAVYAGSDWMRSRMSRRLERAVVERIAGDRPPESAAPEHSVIARRLKAAGLAGPPEAYVVSAGVLAIASSIAVALVLPVPLLAAPCFALALFAPWTAITEVAKYRARRFEQRLIGAIDLMIGALYGGGTLTQALAAAASAAESPVGRELAEAVRRLALGMAIDRAFDRMTTCYHGEGVCLFTQTLAAKQQAGGDLAPTLRALNETLRDRWRIHRELRSQLSGVRITAISGLLLPYVLASLLAWQQPRWFDPLTMHPLGRTLVVLSILLQLAGVLWIWRIVNREI